MKQYMEIELESAVGKKAYRHLTESIVLVRERGENCTNEQAEVILNESGCEVLVAIGELSDVCFIRCLSHAQHVRALELTEYIIGQFGMAKGTEQWAQGSISNVLLSVCMSEAEMDCDIQYFMHKTDEYFTECEVIKAVSFAEIYPDRIQMMKEYEKAPVSWAYVKTTDIAQTGTKVAIRTLENDTGVIVEVQEDIYVMIGCMGEVYQIRRDKFEASYEPSDERLDIFTQLLDFIPAVELVDDATYVPIDEMAHLCYPKKGSAILAQQLEKHTRVFAKDGSDYFVGKQGDYIAVRKDDLQDVYIIRGEVFRRTYREKAD